QRISWDSPRYYDHYIIDVETGRAEPILEDVQASASLSPEGRYVTWWDGNERSWLAYSIESGETVDLTEHLPHPVWNFEGDTPSIPRPWGSPGWATDDQMFLVYDAFDLWAVSPDGLWPPVCITEGVGRATGTRYRRIRLDREERAVPLDEPFLLSTFEEKTKDEGFARDRIRSTTQPKQLLEAAARFSTPRRAEDGDRLLFTQETFERFPDLWVSDLDLQDARQISHANPQQSEYSWGTAELTHWTSLDGVELEGLLYKPEGFDPSRRYPMMVYFYEKNSDALHRYVTPAPARASVNYSFYVSRGYVVFVPDIPYKTGYPGLSALNAVLPGVSALIDRGFVDRERIGVQGHSWGGYQVAYLVTKTDLFAAAEAGAPVSNMVSAYGGIRWSSGMSRMFQYERTQSRIGGTLWDETLHFIENSPVFWLESVTTPLLILHNDEDGAVPWYQGIELFVGLRRLGKPAWLFNYNGEQHGLTRDHNRRDWSVRLQQFFDHYLMDAPPPVWLERGVPAVEKGRDLGLDLIGAPSEDPATLAIAAKRAHDGKLAEWFGPEILAEKIRFESEDGLEIPAYRFVGKEGPGRRAGLVWLHGEACFDAERYRPWIEEAIRRGYVVLAPEVRGCEGYGEEFAARFDPGGADARDVLAAVRVLQADERVDTDRIAVIGWARGGAQALQAALGEDSPVCCAAAVSPFSDLMYRWVMASPEERRRYQSVPALAGGPREAKGEWSRRSLVNRVSELRRPVLLHYAADDELVTAEEIDRLANGIRAADTPGSVLTRFEEGGHGFQLQVLEEGQEPPAAQASSWRELWKFLDVHLMSTAGPEVSGGGGEIPR
ncbi:MAG: alpha/beta fold hydrolase, partial [Planctomycetota bacterium]